MVPDALAYSYEKVTYQQLTPDADGFSYSYELVDTPPTTNNIWPDALVYSFERVRFSTPTPTADGYAYSFDNIASSAVSNPTQVKVWDGTQWVVKPFYVWNGTTWVQPS